MSRQRSNMPDRDRPAAGSNVTLGSHVAARRHLVDGAAHVALHDASTGRVAVVGEREWALIRCADGTRDAEGIRRAAARLGRRVATEQVHGFLAQLEAASLLGEEAASGASPLAPAPAEAGERPLAALPDYRLRCDGRGSCCRFYPTTLFAPLEVVRARALAPEVLDGGHEEERAFTPERGSVHGGGTACAAAMVDGGCAYLDGDRRCVLHARGGPAGKPAGCALFPRVFVDDGEVVRVSVAPECACALRADDGSAGEPLVADGQRRRADLPPAAHVRTLPDRIAWAGARSMSRADFVTWSRDAWHSAAGARSMVGWLWGAADALALGAREPAQERAPDGAAAVFADWESRVAAWLGRNAFRSEGDLARQIAEMARDALEQTALPFEGLPPATPSERLYVQATLFGHLLVDGGVSVEVALRERALRLCLARMLAPAMARRGADAGDRVYDEPLALVEALARGHGLAAYA